MTGYRDVAVIGVGMTKFGEHPDMTHEDLFAEAYQEAAQQAGIDPADVDELIYGNMAAARTDDRTNVHAAIVDRLNLPFPAARTVEGACASSAVALHDAYDRVKTGLADVAVVGGTEKLGSVPTQDATDALATATAADKTFPEVFADAAQDYSDRYSIPMDELRENLAHVSMKNHANGAANPKAMFHGKYGSLSEQDVLDSPDVADPLTLLDCCANADGGAAAIIADAETAEQLVEDPIYIKGTGLAAGGTQDVFGEHAIESHARRTAAAHAYREAGMEPEDVDVVELHDCFTIAEPIALEALGFYDPGEAYTAAKDGETARTGWLPVNPSGGLIGKGHPVGATGTGQLYSAVEALNDPDLDADTALVDTLGGDFGTTTVSILSTEK